MILIPNSWGVDLREYNKCHEPAGSPKGGQFCGTSSDLAVHVDRRTAKLVGVGSERVRTHPNAPPKETEPRWYDIELPNGRTLQIKGRPLTDWERENKVLYHVTTNLEGILGAGEITAFEAGSGLGGGNHPSVSFTTNRRDALNILNVLSVATEIANYGDVQEILTRWQQEELLALAKSTYSPQHRDDGPLDGIPMHILEKAREGLHRAKATYQTRMEIDYVGLSGEKLQDAQAEAGMDALREYLWTRDSVGLGKNPVLFTRARDLRKAKTLGIIVVPGRSLPKNVLVNVGADKFQSEVEVHGDVPITHAYYISRKLAHYTRGR